MNKLITKNHKETREAGKKFSGKIKCGQVVCLVGNLGSGKTTFTQGLLEGLGADGPYTSPTFVVMKEYEIGKSFFGDGKKCGKVYHIDVYRIKDDDILELGWYELISEKSNIVIVEWAERIKDIIPDDAVWVEFKHLSLNEREINFNY